MLICFNDHISAAEIVVKQQETILNNGYGLKKVFKLVNYCPDNLEFINLSSWGECFKLSPASSSAHNEFSKV